MTNPQPHNFMALNNQNITSLSQGQQSQEAQPDLSNQQSQGNQQTHGNPQKQGNQRQGNEHNYFDYSGDQERTHGDHLAAAGDYRDAIKTLREKNKNLTHRDWKVPENRATVVLPSRVKIITFNVNGVPEEAKDYNAKELDTFLSNPPQDPSKPPRRLFLLEGLSPEYVAVFGSHFPIDPTFFMQHQRTALWEGRHRAGNTPMLASLKDPETSFMIEYSELLYFIDTPQIRSLRNPNDNRHINLSRKPKISTDLDQVGIMHRKASFWSQKIKGSAEGTEGWDVLIVVDPPLPTRLEGGREKTVILVGTSKHADEVPLATELYQGGYIDFIPYTSLAEAKTAEAPKRKCMLDDLCFYWKTCHTQIKNFRENPLFASIFLQKIIASNYMTLVGYLEANLSELETAIILSEIKERKKHQALDVTEKWSILQSWSHRFPEYCGMIDDLLEWHSIPKLPPNIKDAWENCEKDFKDIQRRLSNLRSRTQLLSESFVGLATMAGIQESLDEAKGVKVLTFLGFFFLPLSLISALFTLPDEYGLGKGRFWLYAAIAFPTAAVITCVATTLVFGWRANFGKQYYRR
ncbi:uncharacterized protein K441DRAFT_681398 [Cenococcum geophilum 1.58]|uniref:uncharacterized protein n=1 Tax=Cenococcum geophilum 1.58 TaxID=794803 RepID=UPI00358F1AED|nr:hypothetical protein K441DRAFT_681398 [Cenococcum geophilum 1.58]